MSAPSDPFESAPAATPWWTAARERLARLMRPVPRRRAPAGHAVAVAVLALAVAALLEAQGLHKTAETQAPGTKRDVAVALTGTLAGFTHLVHIDGPRAGLLAALGRGGEDRISTQTTLASTPPHAGHGRGGPGRGGHGRGGAGARLAGPPHLAFSPRHKLPILIAGDSLSITPGLSLLQLAGAARVIRPVEPVDGHVDTGLTRPDIFNWFSEIDDVTSRLRPRAVILTFGANDDSGYMTGVLGDAGLGAFGSRAWRREYRRRVDSIMDGLIAKRELVFWIGLPIVRDPAQNRRFRVISRIEREEAAKRPGWVSFIDTYRLFEDAQGGYADYLPVHGSLVDVRTGDGIHFQPAGGELIARRVLAALQRRFDLTSWRRGPSPLPAVPAPGGR